MSRTLIVANRLPSTVVEGPQGPTIVTSTGGLATGLRSVHEAADSLWFGWTGVPDEVANPELDRTWIENRCVPIPLSRAEVTGYYENYCNGVIWPLFHSLLGHLPLNPGRWVQYEVVNRRFANAIQDRYRDGDVIWIHDYQLMRVPALVRRRIPDALVGFFLHVPFPPAEIFCTLPDRRAILEGLLGADVIGFHTAAYLRNFAAAVLQVLGVSADVDCVNWHGRQVRLGVFPMGIDAGRFATRSATPEVKRLTAELRGADDVRMMLGVDRLDYTKGIPRRLLAFETFLRRHPEWHGRTRLVQLGVPSRTDVPEYRRYRDQIDRLVGRINGAFGTATWAPVHHLVRSLTEDEVIALYRAADVMVVTPVRDGMNLVAKEFVASRVDEDGVLVLSEFAGAAWELGEAIQINPYDVRRSANALHQALMMPRDERRVRMQGLRKRVLTFTAQRWAEVFLDAVRDAGERKHNRRLRPSSPQEIDQAIRRACSAHELMILLDYDGTLVPFAPVPDLAPPDAEALALLTALAERPHTTVHIVSGRNRVTLEDWLGELPVSLHAEHGFWTRRSGSKRWEQLDIAPMARRAEVLRVLEEAVARVPGTLIEEKTVGLAWHYRAADPVFAERQAHELRAHLSDLLSNEPVEVLAGDKVIELRPHGVTKGVIARTLSTEVRPGGIILAMGDDRTDEDLFAALPPEAISIHVGAKPSVARLRVESVEDVRQLLRTIAGLADETPLIFSAEDADAPSLR